MSHLKKIVYRYTLAVLLLLSLADGFSQRGVPHPVEAPRRVREHEEYHEKRRVKESAGLTENQRRFLEHVNPVRLPSDHYIGKTLKQVLAENKNNVYIEFDEPGAAKPISYSRRTARFTIGDNLVVRGNLNLKIEDLLAFRKQTVTRSAVHYTSVIDHLSSDKTNHSLLTNAAEKNGANYSTLSRENMEKVFKNASHGLLLLSGHHENGALFARTVDDKAIENKTFSEQELKSLSEKYDVNLVFLGCETADIESGTGFQKKVYDDEVTGIMTKIMQTMKEQREVTNAMLYELMTLPDNMTIISSFQPPKDGKGGFAKVDHKPNRTAPPSEPADAATEEGSSLTGLLLMGGFLSLLAFVIVADRKKTGTGPEKITATKPIDDGLNTEN